MSADLIRYHEAKALYYQKNPHCEFEVAKGVLCEQTRNVEIHHKRKRGKNLCNDLMTVCRYHHDIIENNKKEARKKGYILDAPRPSRDRES